MDMPIITGDHTALNNVMNRCMNSRYMNEDFDKAWDRHEQDEDFVAPDTIPDFPNATWSQAKTSNPLEKEQSGSLYGGPEGLGKDILAEAVEISEIGTNEEEVAKKLQKKPVQVEIQNHNQQLPIPPIIPVPKEEIDEFASLENLTNKAPSFTESETMTTTFTINIPAKEVQIVQPIQKPQNICK